MTQTAESRDSVARQDTPFRTKLIEVALPLEAINVASAREKSIRHGHPSTLHLWWARRPLAACRAVLFSQLVDDPSAWPKLFPTEEAQETERLRLFEIIDQLVLWENSTNEDVLLKARREIARSLARGAGIREPETAEEVWAVLREHAPPVLDPFCGGGSIPLEAQRLGLEAHASDLNPVAVLITKALIEIPPKFAGLPPVNPRDRERGMGAHWKGAAGLAADVRYYGEWMREEAQKRIGHLYPKVKLPEGGEATVIAWLWARTVTCPNPACGARMPLVRSFALSTKKGKETWVEPVVDREAKTVRFEVKSGKGTVPEPPKVGRGAKFRCLVCGNTAEDQHIKDEAKAGRMRQQLMAVVGEGHRGRVYVSPSREHEQSVVLPLAVDPPTQPLAIDPRAIWCVGYGLDTFDKLFTPRQLVALTTFSDLVGEARERVMADYPHPLAPSPSRGEGEVDSPHSALWGEGEGEAGVGTDDSGGEGAIAPAENRPAVSPALTTMSPLFSRGRGAGGEGAGEGEEGERLEVPPGLRARMVEVARGFRREPTPSEGLLWGLVRGSQLGTRFRRQQPIGPFVVDFFCAEHRLIVEVDGEVHASQGPRDRERQDLLEACGYSVLRLPASEVERDPHVVLQQIQAALTRSDAVDAVPVSTPASSASTATAPTSRAAPVSPLSSRGRGAGGEGAAAYADAVATYLALAVDRSADFWCTIATWSPQPKNEIVGHAFGRQALPMTWDFGEINPFSQSGGNFLGNLEFTAKALGSVPAGRPGYAALGDASLHNHERQTFCVSTDPPYYDNIGYADLSDFFYVWMRRSLRRVYPDMFRTMLVPKAAELVATPYRFDGDKKKAERFFEEGLGRAFDAMHDSQNGQYPLTVFYAFKQTEVDDEGGGSASTGWETMLTGLLRSGFGVTGTWPNRSERPQGLKTGTNALASSIVLVCRPRPADAPIATRRELISALREELPTAVRHLTRGNIAPVDLAQAAIGPGMRVFSRYAKVMEANGEPMRVRTALGLINTILYEVETEAESEYDPDTRWAITWFEQFGAGEGPYGDAETLSKAKDTSVAGLREAGIVHSRGGKVRLLRRDELPSDWDPITDRRLTVWEVTQHLIRALDTSGERGAADLLQRVGGLGESARALSYALYLVADRKKWTDEALAYNGLAIAWPELTRLAGGATGPAQGTLGV